MAFGEFRKGKTMKNITLMHSKWGLVAAATTVFALAFSMGNSNLPEASAEEAVPSVNISAPVQIESLSTPVQSGKLLQEVGEVEVTAAISDGADTYSLYPEFKDPGEAIKKMQDNDAVVILRDSFQLAPLSEGNWGDYRWAYYEFLDSSHRPEWFVEGDDEVLQLLQFFDIYENTDQNAAIIASAKNSDVSKISENETLMNELPYTSHDAIGKKMDFDGSVTSVVNQPVLTSALSGFNVAKAYGYATSYATKPNTSSYQYFSKGDCANFASQIMENAGVRQTSKWWHRRVGNLHVHSNAWIRADDFARNAQVN